MVLSILQAVLVTFTAITTKLEVYESLLKMAGKKETNGYPCQPWKGPAYARELGGRSKWGSFRIDGYREEVYRGCSKSLKKSFLYSCSSLWKSPNMVILEGIE